jgi:NADH dehydrogenase FAD-containing subunit
MVDEVDKTGLQLSDGTTIPAAVVVWAAGVRAYQGHRRMTPATGRSPPAASSQGAR